ncbi:hypothetical protein ASN18_0276 [Candidatus Magnetominusculus xianensis]|uniref:Uncharacterized protein n=1 Tax=Candidatus Magnetominusculus xianensis TaxID=1748249 RepID=A0ABR5SNN6_9BACT|nr:hypothetical protein ASN18_0276 [Candidatus Magnetominusculus xianensis]
MKIVIPQPDIVGVGTASPVPVRVIVAEAEVAPAPVVVANPVKVSYVLAPLTPKLIFKVPVLVPVSVGEKTTLILQEPGA